MKHLKTLKFYKRLARIVFLPLLLAVLASAVVLCCLLWPLVQGAVALWGYLSMGAADKCFKRKEYWLCEHVYENKIPPGTLNDGRHNTTDCLDYRVTNKLQTINTYRFIPWLWNYYWAEVKETPIPRPTTF